MMATTRSFSIPDNKKQTVTDFFDYCDREGRVASKTLINLMEKFLNEKR